MKKLCEDNKIIFVKRDKNMQTLFDLGLNIHDVINAILHLELRIILADRKMILMEVKARFGSSDIRYQDKVYISRSNSGSMKGRID